MMKTSKRADEGTELDLSGRNLVNLQQQFGKLVFTFRLSISDNPLLSLDGIQVLTNLTHLNVSRTLISDFAPIQLLIQMKSITAQNCQISDLQHLQNLSNLTHLYLDSNRITDSQQLLFVKNLKRLELFWIMNNPICCETNFEAVLKENCSQVKNLNKKVVKVEAKNDNIRVSKK
ncbi:DUF11_domain-containing protein [Hexamita inflata]|uniref:DUF11 domain-containing protein n=1 Tax=Hexamita inflata TaxID=28002 RepID=A0AA86PRN5_9EUKA|nr:DUF11 domain-containing protein [Hexamita inflata]